MNWSPDRTEMAVALWQGGKTASRIAAILGGGLTRNAVLGKFHRMQLPRRVTEDRPMSMECRDTRARATVVETRAKEAHIPVPKAKQTLRPALAPPVLFAAGEKGRPRYGELSLLDLTNKTCRWPHGSGPFTFCGHVPRSGSPYCPYHADVATSKGTYSERDAHRVKIDGQRVIA